MDSNHRPYFNAAADFGEPAAVGIQSASKPFQNRVFIFQLKEKNHSCGR
jgi:hypothetical protein